MDHRTAGGRAVGVGERGGGMQGREKKGRIPEGDQLQAGERSCPVFVLTRDAGWGATVALLMTHCWLQRTFGVKGWNGGKEDGGRGEGAQMERRGGGHEIARWMRHRRKGNRRRGGGGGGVLLVGSEL